MRLPAVLCLAALVAASPLRAEEPKITLETLLAKHRESLGPAEALAAARSRLVEGTTGLRILTGGNASLSGRATVASEPGSVKARLRFEAQDYYGEEFTRAGDKTDVGYAQPAHRSPLGSFLASYDEPLREGLLAGVLATAWPLLAADAGGAKLKYDGLKKVDDRMLHQVTYQPKKRRSDLRILVFFEPDTFRHVRTTYAITVPPVISGSIDNSYRQSDSRFSLEETFGAFKPTGALVLPTEWTLRFSAEEGGRTTLWKWDTAVQNVR